MQTGIELIAQERWEQVYKHSRGMKHDAEHDTGQLAKAAAALALTGTDAWVEDPIDFIEHETQKGEWGLCKHIGADRIKALTVAGALIVAELDRVLNKEDLFPSGGL